MTLTTADVAVVGGGPAGTLCAICLARLGHDVLVVNGPGRRSDWAELLSPRALLGLERILLRPEIGPSWGAPCRGIFDTWRRSGSEFQDFGLWQCSPGLIVRRGQLDVKLQEAATAEGVRVLHAARNAQLIGGPDGGALELAVADDCVRTAFIVDATGGHSGLMPREFRRRLRFDRLIAVGFTLEANASLGDTMRLASSSSGWWYTLPLEGQRWFVVFLTDGDLVSVRGARLRELLSKQFQEAFASIPPNLPRALAAAVLRDARTTCAVRQWRGRWLRIGDAAFSMDPVSGSGLAEGILHAERAAASISDYLRRACTRELQNFARGRIESFATSLDQLRVLYAGNGPTKVESESPFWRRRARADASRAALELIPYSNS